MQISKDTNSSVSSSLKIRIRGRSPRIFRFDKTRAVSVLSKKRSVIGCFRFLIQLLSRMKFYIKSRVRLYQIVCSLVLFMTSVSFIRYKVTVMVLICFVFHS